MKFEDIDGENWPIAELGDFDTEDGDEKFFITEDENGEGVSDTLSRWSLSPRFAGI